LKTSLAIALLFFCLIVASATAQTPTPLPASIPGTFLNLANGKIYYEECGVGPQTVVLVHDGVLDSAVWNDVWPEFCRQFHTIRYDRRGYGRSPAATDGHFATDDLAALLRHLKVAHAAIVGSSHGGEISINFALDHPEIVQQLVLVGAVVSGMPYSQHFLDRGSVLGKPLEKRRHSRGNCDSR
jgi:pimeloyl-ACP methyl ester carboxylesterase